MRLDQLQSERKHKKKRVGRGDGSGRGTYSGRGIKGQKSRSGAQIPGPSLISKMPKLRGEGFQHSRRKQRTPEIAVVNLRDLQKRYQNGEKVSLSSLIQKGIIDKKIKKVKILAEGKLNKKLRFDKNLLFSKNALKKIQ